MRNHKKVTGRASSIPGGLAIGGLTSMAITLTLAAVLAKLVSSGILDPAKIGYGVMILLFTASFLGAAVTQGRVKHRRIQMCLMAGGVYFLLLISITALFFGGQYTGIGATALMVLSGAGTAALTAARTGAKGIGRGRAGTIRAARSPVGKQNLPL